MGMDGGGTWARARFVARFILRTGGKPDRRLSPAKGKFAARDRAALCVKFCAAILAVAAAAHGAPQQAGETAVSSEAGPALTIDQAVQLALTGNGSVQIAALEVTVAQESVAATKTHYYPANSLYVFGSQPFTPLNFTYAEGAFGTYPGIGPIPAQNTTISSGDTFTTYIVGHVSQPLTQLYKVGLGVDQQRLMVAMDQEKLRQQKQNVVRDVKQAFCKILETQSSLEASQATVKFLEELDRVTANYLTQKVVLESDSLKVKAQLASQEVTSTKLQDALDTQKENLNQLMGRDIRTEYSVQEVPAPDPKETNLKEAENTALAQRPEVHEGKISVDQAKIQRRQTKAGYIPDISLSAQYISPFNVAILPKNIATFGVEMSWEPWDWGRKQHEMRGDDAQISQAKVALTDTERKVLIDVNASYRQLLETRGQLTAAEADEAATKAKLQETMNKYKQQTVQLKDVLEQQAAVSKADSAYQEALSDFWSAKADFEKALGEDQ
jgi:outer membrane protein